MSILAPRWRERSPFDLLRVISSDLPGSAAISAAGAPFLLTRAILISLAMAVAAIQRQSPLAVWNQWDSNWYIGIARFGYHWILPGHYASSFRGATMAFFPLLPAVIHVGDVVHLPDVLTGVIVSNLAMFGALLYMYPLFEEEWGDRAARWALFIVSIFPTAFYTFAPYSDALFLFAAAGTLYHARRQDALATGLMFGLAAVSRSTGIILLLPAILLLRPRRLTTWLTFLGPACVAGLTYVTYLWWQHIPLSYLLLAQHAWHRGLTAPWAGFVGSLLWLPHGIITAPQLAVENIGELFLTCVGIVITARAWPQLSGPLRAYCAGFWLLVLCSPEWQDSYAAPFSSMDRYVLALFPLAGWAAANLDKRHLYRVLAVFGVSFVATATVYLFGSWIG